MNLGRITIALSLAISCTANSNIPTKSLRASLLNEKGSTEARNLQDAKLLSHDQNAFADFGGCVLGFDIGGRAGQSITINEDGTTLLATSLDSVYLLKYDRYTGWTVVFDFTPLIQKNPQNLQGGKLGYYAHMTTAANAVVIGVPSDPSQGTDTGAVIVFEKQNDVWTQIGGIIRGDNGNDQFGFSVAMTEFGILDSRRLLIGAPGGGYAKTFRYNPLIAGSWEYRGSMDELGDRLPETGFGYSVDISARGAVGVAGAPFLDSSTGIARAYDLDDYEFTQQLTGSNPGANAGFSVAVSGDGLTSAVGLPLAGEVKVFRFNVLLNTWSKIQNDIRISTPETQFGAAIDLSYDGLRLIVGAPESSVFVKDAGAVYSYEFNPLPKPGDDWDHFGNYVLLGEPFNGLNRGGACGYVVTMSPYAAPDGAFKYAISCLTFAGQGLDTNRGQVCMYSELFSFPSTAPSSVPTSSPTITSPPTTSRTPSATHSPSISTSPTALPTKDPTPPTPPTMFPTTSPETRDPGEAPDEPIRPPDKGPVTVQIIFWLLSMLLTFITGMLATGCYGFGYVWDCIHGGYAGYYCYDWGYYFSDWWHEPWHQQQQQ